MKNIELVNSISHRDIKINTKKTRELGDGVKLVEVFPLEFRFLQAHYPILFQKNNETQRHVPVAIFGFEEGENLFLNENGWNATYIPLMMQRQPFHIGFQQSPLGSKDDRTRVMHINMDSPRVGKVHGERLFLEQGGNSEYLDHMASILETIHQWNEHGKRFDELLTEYELLETVTFDITLTSGKQAQVLGYSTINEDRLNALSGAQLARLNEMGYLMPIYMAIASVSNIQKLILLKSQVEARSGVDQLQN